MLADGERLRRFYTVPEFGQTGGVRIARDEKGVPTTLVGMVAPFNKVVDTGEGYREVILPNAFEKTIRERGKKILLQSMHSERQQQPIGRATGWQAAEEGLIGTFRLARTRDAADAVALIEEGISTGLSIEGYAVPGQTETVRQNDGFELRRRHQIALTSVALVPSPAYGDDSQVLHVA